MKTLWVPGRAGLRALKILQNQGPWAFPYTDILGCMRRGSYSAKGVFLPSKRLLSAFYNPPPSKNPSKNLCLYWIPYKATSKNPFYFFSVRGRGKRRRRPRRWPGGRFSLKIEGGGFCEEESWEGEGRWGHVCGEGGGLNIFFRARSSHQVLQNQGFEGHLTWKHCKFQDWRDSLHWKYDLVVPRMLPGRVATGRQKQRNRREEGGKRSGGKSCARENSQEINCLCKCKFQLEQTYNFKQLQLLTFSKLFLYNLFVGW